MIKKEKIMVFGTFDGLHKGHLNFFKQARKLSKNPFLIVSIARDVNVKKIKGLKPYQNESKRMILVKKSKLVDKVVLSGKDNYLPHILRERPDIIALGYDQRWYTETLKKDLKNPPARAGKAGKGLDTKVIRLKPYKKHIYKNSLLKKNTRL